MTLAIDLTELLTPIVTEAGLFLEEVQITPAGKRRVVSVIIDGADRNPNLDEVTLVSKSVSALLDSYTKMGDMPFTLEVTTPGVDRPLTLPRHWHKNIGRLVRITPFEGESFIGRIISTNNEAATIDLPSGEETILLNSVKRAVIQIEFNRKDVK